jgi:hypothetical protein
MSKYHGMLLFDIADNPIGKWHENLGTRGYYDRWEIRDKNGKIIQSIIIEIDEESDGQWDVYWEDASGSEEFIGYAYYDDAIKLAKKFTGRHLNGYDYKNKRGTT